MSGSSRNVVVTGTLATSGAASPSVAIYGNFNVTISGSFTGTAQVQRSFDNGTTWNTVSTDGTGSAASYSAPCSVTGIEVEWALLYRIYCSALSAGSITYRLSANPVLSYSALPQ